MSVKAFIFLFPILFLLLIPVTAGEEPLDINITFREFYEVNISGALAKNIGVAGLGYHPTVCVNSTSKEVDLTNRSLEVTFNYDDFNPRNLPIFGYEGHFSRNVTFPISFSLADELKNGECDCFQFEILLVKPGSYWVEWFEIVDGKRMVGSGKRIQIIEPYEWENIIKQADLIEAEKKSAEASEKSAKASEGTANATKSLANKTFALVIVATITAIIALYEVIWKRLPNIKIVSITNDETNPLKKNENGYIGFIRVFVRNNSYIPLRCRGSVRTDQGTFPLYDWDKYVQRISEPPIGLEAFRSFDLSPIGSIELRGEIKSSEDFVTIEISYGKKKPQKRKFSLKELEGVG